jgi:hypothetical protein
VMNSLAGIDRPFHDREGSGRAIAVLVVPVMRRTHYQGANASPQASIIIS